MQSSHLTMYRIVNIKSSEDSQVTSSVAISCLQLGNVSQSILPKGEISQLSFCEPVPERKRVPPLQEHVWTWEDVRCSLQQTKKVKVLILMPHLKQHERVFSVILSDIW